jgi:hypothetical protein
MSDNRENWELSESGQSDLGALSPEDQDRIIEKLDEIANSP